MANTLDVYFGDNRFITFGEIEAREFISTYEEAASKQESGFNYEGIYIEVTYAKYVAEFLKDKLKLQ